MALTKVSSDMVSPDPTNASNLSSGSVPVAQLGNVPASDTSSIESDIALLGFKIASNGSLSKYNLVDQTEDAFEDQTGIDASASSDEVYNTSGKYFSGQVSAPTGGTKTTYTDSGTDYVVHSFLSGTTDFTLNKAGTVDYLLVGGGGGGGSAQLSGGGGAGGMITGSSFAVTLGDHSVVVGDGGESWVAGNATTGGNTTFSSLTALGGGGGVGNGGGVASGGSGGGGNGYAGSGGAGTVGQGNAGGAGTNHGAGGGGGAGAVGAGAVSPNGGNGGVGVSNSLRTNSGVFYAGGGGGNKWTGSNGSGGNGGGGDATDGTGNSGTANTGAGGGAGGSAGGLGGTGIAVFRYVDGAFGPTYNQLTLVSNATTATTTATKGDIVMTYTNGAGTAAINTDLTAEFSADNGSNWTSMTLVAQGNTGAASPHFIVAAHNVTAGTSGTQMKYRIKTFNQSISKETRIHAVSLGWS